MAVVRVKNVLLFTVFLLIVSTAYFAWSLPRPPMMVSKLMWFVEPTHYLMILGWPIINFSLFGHLAASAIVAVCVVIFMALFIWLWRRPHLSLWLYWGIFAWILIGTFLVWAEIVASI